jgi:hypothetical protein
MRGDRHQAVGHLDIVRVNCPTILATACPTGDARVTQFSCRPWWTTTCPPNESTTGDATPTSTTAHTEVDPTRR